MSASFIATNSSYLAVASPLISTTPFTVGMWVNFSVEDALNRTIFSLSDSGTSTNFLRLIMTEFERFAIGANAAGTEQIGTASLTIIPAQWHFILGRFITAANRRLEILYSDGRVENIVNSVTVSPTGLDNMTVGALSTSVGITIEGSWDGKISEFWYTNSDVRLVGTAIPKNELIKFAFDGPFGFPHIANKIIEYRSFRKTLVSDQDQGDDVYWGGFGRARWANNQVTLGPHVPTTPWYPQGYPSRAYDLLRRDVFQPAAAPAGVTRLRYPVRMDGIGYGGIFPGNVLHQKARDG